MEKYELLYDLHTHTTYSHGKGSVEDNVRAAMNRGLSYIAISDPYTVLTQVQAGCLLLIGPLIILFIVLQRHFVESIERTGLVG